MVIFFSKNEFRFVKYIFLLILAVVPIEASEKMLHVSTLGEYEVHTIGSKPQNDDNYGISAVPNSSVEVIKFKNGLQISKFSYNIDAYGFRKSSASHLPGKNKHLILIGASNIFGENLNDDQTIAHAINSRSKNFEAYPLAFFGYGPNHSWLRFSQNNLKKSILQKQGSAILFTSEGDIERFFGKADHLSYVIDHPRIIEKDVGIFEHIGSFRNSGTLLQRTIFKYCIPYLFCNNFLSKFKFALSDDEMRIVARLFEDIQKKYNEQFQVDQFKIIWIGGVEYYNILKKYSKIEVIRFPYDSSLYEGEHPKAHAFDKLVDDLFERKILY